jgi:hypothetical protein
MLNIGTNCSSYMDLLHWYFGILIDDNGVLIDAVYYIGAVYYTGIWEF